MNEVVAQPKFACPSCGAEAQWNAAKQALVCPYCGTTSPAKLNAEGGLVEEHDLVAALRSIPDEMRGWQREKVSVKCQSCQAISVFEPNRVGQRCDFCGSTQLAPYEQIKAPIRPESLLPFKFSESQVRDSIRQWYANRWFAPDRLKSAAHMDTIHGVYIPYWTFDAQVAADWTAESGYHYYETESYEDSDGRVQTRQVQYTRWEYSAGHVDHFFDDELVPASVGVPEDLLRKIEPFPTNDLVPYDASYLSGWVVEQYQIDLVAGAQRAREVMEGKMRGLCERQVPGDTHRNLDVAADYSGQTFKHVLLPLWILSYQYGAESYPVVVNGYTGQIAGKHPLSWMKILLAVLAVLIGVALLVLYSQHP